MKLYNLQQKFAQAALANTPDGIMQSICRNPITPAQRLSVYHNNVIGNLTDTLADTFSATQKLVGEEFFRTMARKFIVGNPPAAANLNRYGGDFSSFIEQYAPASSVPYLSDIARFEWLWNESYLAADDNSLAVEEINRIKPEDYPSLHITFRNSAKLLAANYPVDDIWLWCDDQSKIDVPDINSGGVFLLLLRPELDVVVTRITRAEYLMLLALSVGSSFEDAAIKALSEDTAFDFAAFLLRHFERRSFQSLE